MHAASWPRVKWLRPSWSRKDFLTACGSVLVGTISLISHRLVSSCVVLLGPLGGRSVSSLGSLGGLGIFGPSCGLPGGIWAPGPLLGRSWPLWGRAWPAPGSLLGRPWRPLGRSRWPLGRQMAAQGKPKRPPDGAQEVSGTGSCGMCGNTNIC